MIITNGDTEMTSSNNIIKTSMQLVRQSRVLQKSDGDLSTTLSFCTTNGKKLFEENDQQIILKINKKESLFATLKYAKYNKKRIVLILDQIMKPVLVDRELALYENQFDAIINQNYHFLITIAAINQKVESCNNRRKETININSQSITIGANTQDFINELTLLHGRSNIINSRSRLLLIPVYSESCKES